MKAMPEFGFARVLRAALALCLFPEGYRHLARKVTAFSQGDLRS
jgi:hypothetical protein